MSSLLKGIGEFCDGIGEFCQFLVIVGLILLAATKPDEQAHRAAIAERTPVFHAAASVMELVGGRQLEYHDYLIFSVMTMKSGNDGPGLLISIGVLNKVY